MSSLYSTDIIIKALKNNITDTNELEQAVQYLINPDKCLMDNLSKFKKELNEINEIKNDIFVIELSRIKPIRYEYVVDGHEWLGYFIEIAGEICVIHFQFNNLLLVIPRTICT